MLQPTATLRFKSQGGVEALAAATAAAALAARSGRWRLPVNRLVYLRSEVDVNTLPYAAAIVSRTGSGTSAVYTYVLVCFGMPRKATPAPRITIWPHSTRARRE